MIASFLILSAVQYADIYCLVISVAGPRRKVPSDRLSNSCVYYAIMRAILQLMFLYVVDCFPFPCRRTKKLLNRVSAPIYMRMILVCTES